MDNDGRTCHISILYLVLLRNATGLVAEQTPEKAEVSEYWDQIMELMV